MIENKPSLSDNVGRIGTFITTKNFFYRGRLLAIIGEPVNCYRILDIKTNQQMDLLITSVETIKWEGV